MSCSESSKRDRRKGAALIVVLWTVTVLAALAAQFAIAMRQDAESTITFKQEAIAHYTVIAAVNDAILSIESFNGELDPLELEEDLGGAGIGEEIEDDGLGAVRRLIEGRGDWVEGRFNGAVYEVRAIDEYGRIPLNAAAVDEVLLREIMLNLGYDQHTAEIVADSIVDWRDEDDLHLPSGAEDDYYESLPRPYGCKDAPFDSLEELLLVQGVTRAMYLGDELSPGLRYIFTVMHDRPRITLGSISREVELALCGEEFLDEESERTFGARSRDQEAIDLSACLATTGLSVRQGERNGRPRISLATIEARVKEEGASERVIAHAGVTMQFKNDGFQAYQWYDSIFGE